MNETDFIREQLTIERAHLRDILNAVRESAPTAGHLRPAAAYIEWARERLVAQLAAHRGALEALPQGADMGAQLRRLATASARLAEHGSAPPLPRVAEPLLALLDAWSDALEALAGRTLRLSHWRRAAQLSADTILEERQRYTAAHAATGRS